VKVVVRLFCLGLLVLTPISPALAQYGEEGFVSAEYDPEKITPEMIEQTNTIAAALDTLNPEGWARKSMVERYTPTNLYDKINGRSELYMAYGVIGMSFLTFTDTTEPRRFIDIFLYDMGSNLGAFGIYSVERWEGGEPLDIGNQAYRTDRDLFFRKGHYYATILAADDDERTIAAQHAIAEKLAGELEGEDESLWGFEVLPEKDRVEASMQYFAEDALSLDFMKNTFTALYEVNGEKVQVFVAKYDSPADAATAAEEYATYLNKYASNVETTDADGAKATLGDVGGGYYDGVFASGIYVVGATAAKGKDAAANAVAMIAAALP
jgi:hypothetical protein